MAMTHKKRRNKIGKKINGNPKKSRGIADVKMSSSEG